ncbi:AtpZ/AtpI family protein [Neobacillus mesonae]|uniref:AtpZ/AtpI family protein n=1 Tax=Neobacillus mesonae TaxID=1193713 RepID=UPI002042291C|nr:AtpZ/AtpI family protein [Neobacillus mesonae]MCM3567209.1 AtpZ/AtpI family protein [Neobacillus mesonae]
MKNDHNPFKAMGLMSAILSALAGSVLIGVFGGKWLDQYWGTEPVFLIIGLFVGLGAGIYSMVVSIRHFYSGDS